MYTVTELADGRTVGITHKALSPVVTKIKIRVGIWGDQAVSRLLLTSIEERLAPFFDTAKTEPFPPGSQGEPEEPGLR